MKGLRVTTKEEPPQVVLSKKELLAVRQDALRYVQQLKTEPGVVRDLDSSQRLTNVFDRLEDVLAVMTETTVGRLRLKEHQELSIMEEFARQTYVRGLLATERKIVHDTLKVVEEGLVIAREEVVASVPVVIEETIGKAYARIDLQDTARSTFEAKIDQERIDRKAQAQMSLQELQDGINGLRDRSNSETAERKSDMAEIAALFDAKTKPILADIRQTGLETRQKLAEISKHSDQSYEAFRLASVSFEKQITTRLSQWQAAILTELQERVRASIETASLTESFLKTVEAGIAQDSANARNHVNIP